MTNVEQIQFITGVEMNPVGNGRIEVVLRAGSVEVSQRIHGATRRWAARLLESAWDLLRQVLIDARFPQPVAPEPRLPGMDTTEIICTTAGMEERVRFHNSPGTYLEFRKLAYSLLAQIAPGVMPEPPWPAPRMIDDAHEN